MYYFDNSATTPIHPRVSELMNDINIRIYGNPSSTYKIGKNARSIMENARIQIAKAISAEPNQILFTSGGTESNNQVLWSMIQQKRKHIVSSTIEHPAITRVLKFLITYGLNHNLADVNEDGIISIDSINKNLNNDTILISLMLANNEIGTIQPLEQVISIAHNQKIMVHTDAVQCLGKIKLNVSKLKVDFLSLSAHKFYGPKGIGVLYARHPEKLYPLILGGGQENNLRAGTENVSLIAGMGLAAEISTELLNEKNTMVEKIEQQFKSGLKTFFPKAQFNGCQSKKLPGIVNVSFPGNKSNILMAKLERVGIAVSNGSACGSGDIKPSPVLSSIGLNKETNLSTLRFSFGIFNTKEQVDFLLSNLKSILVCS
ncbi:MAG: cysteine desulfurase NifS [Candidatus Marinimicrobia bacterium]|nr:cysteine desulfurase NifS [Candidatus Neomarinimicrobiota bacterium]